MPGMLGFGRKREELVQSLPERIVDELAAEFDRWQESQKNAFAQVLCRLLPKIAAESGDLSGLPLDRVLDVLKRNFWRLLPALALNREKTMAELGRAFMTRGKSIREFCARAAQTIPELQKGANDNGQSL
jgi:hypothetical protein